MRNTENWIKWWRKAETNDVLECEKFDKLHAFLYLVEEANYKGGTTKYGEKIKRGQLKTSVRKLAREFGWDKEVVMCFLNDLEKHKMIKVDRTPKGSVISILNYRKYQGQPDTKPNTESNTKSNTKSTLSKKNKEDEKKAPNSAPNGTETVQKEEWLPPVEEW